MPTEPARPGEETLTSSAWVASGSYATIAQMEVWGPSPLLRWSKAGKLQQQWYEQYRGAVEWRDVPDEEGKEATGADERPDESRAELGIHCHEANTATKDTSQNGTGARKGNE